MKLYPKKSRQYCPVCKSRKIIKFWAMSGYRLARCSSCAMVWDYNPPTNAYLYDENYFINENPKGGYANYYEGMRVNKKTFYERLKKIEKKLGNKGKLLDVGCALGDCLVEAKKLGWKDVQGVEVSEFAHKIAKRRNLNVRSGDIFKNPFHKDSFDVILYQDVIEHIVDPVGELKRVYQILKPGGIIFLVTPDTGGWWSKILGPLWYHYKPMEHISYFSKKSMILALQKSGFDNISIQATYHVLSLEYILNRLKFYAPTFFEFLLKISRKTPFRDVPFNAYIGELEAWGQKPKRNKG